MEENATYNKTYAKGRDCSDCGWKGRQSLHKAPPSAVYTRPDSQLFVLRTQKRKGLRQQRKNHQTTATSGARGRARDTIACCSSQSCVEHAAAMTRLAAAPERPLGSPLAEERESQGICLLSAAASTRPALPAGSPLGESEAQSQRYIIVLFPRGLDLLGAQHIQRAADAFARG